MADRHIRRPTRKRDVYVAIMVAAANGRGLILTRQECHELTGDDAIATRASNALSEAEWDAGWVNIDPFKNREPWNGNCRDIHGRWAETGVAEPLTPHQHNRRLG